jgi:hypothetical protein
MEEQKRTPRELIKKMHDLSFSGVQYPTEYGGVGSTYLEYVMVIEELSRVYCSIGGHISVNCLCAGTINDFGTVEQKKKYLPSLVQGDTVGSFAFTEPPNLSRRWVCMEWRSPMSCWRTCAFPSKTRQEVKPVEAEVSRCSPRILLLENWGSPPSVWAWLRALSRRW